MHHWSLFASQFIFWPPYVDWNAPQSFLDASEGQITSWKSRKLFLEILLLDSEYLENLLKSFCSLNNISYALKESEIPLENIPLISKMLTSFYPLTSENILSFLRKPLLLLTKPWTLSLILVKHFDQSWYFWKFICLQMNHVQEWSHYSLCRFSSEFSIQINVNFFVLVLHSQ